jgi:hypothetical protein
MALKLSQSVFCHIGRTAGHWVRRTLGEQGLSRGDVAGFHDWPSRCWQAEPSLTGTFTFCFIRHPLSWLRSYWMHQMQFGWEDFDEYSRWLRSWNFEEFLERSIQTYPEGPVSAVFAPFVAECSFVGRQESPRESLIAALSKAGERFDPTRISDLHAGIPIDKEILSYAKAPLPILSRVMEVERDLCARWGYAGIPENVVGKPGPFRQPFFDLSWIQDRGPADASLKPVIVGNGHRPVTPCIAPPNGGRTELCWGELSYFGRYSALKHRILDTLEVAGRDVLCVDPKDLIIPLHLLGKGARSVTVVSESFCSLGPECGDTVSRYGLKLLSRLSEARGTYPEGADIVVSLAELACKRHPFHYFHVLEKQLKAGGILVLDGSIVEICQELPLLFCPEPEKAPECECAASYFNAKGIEDALRSCGFSKVQLLYKHIYQVVGSQSEYLTELSKNAGAPDAGVFARCIFAAQKAIAPATENLEKTKISTAELWGLWKSEIDEDAGASNPKHPEAPLGSVLARLEEIERLKVQVGYWRAACEDRDRDLIRARQDSERIAKELHQQAEANEALVRELLHRTSDLIQVRELLVDRTHRL